MDNQKVTVLTLLDFEQRCSAEYIWNLRKQRVAAKNINQYEKEIEGLTREAVNSITASDWKKEIEHIEKLESEYWEKDRQRNRTEGINYIPRRGRNQLRERK
ncbi:unnamed protein product [Euphydryas editha]|uniref:Uncharacterized protein n=1 Tax=Euphydryas editha TaxID=104508 RepID=A0AAU9U5Q6_EUPED|nr:unnamed protein product [Euphydryas editha]